jgi:hypothetical protein
MEDQNLLIITPPAKFGNVYIFELQNRPINLSNIIVEKCDFQGITEFGKIFHNFHPIFPSDSKTLNHSFGFVMEHKLFQERHLKASYAG